MSAWRESVLAADAKQAYYYYYYYYYTTTTTTTTTTFTKKVMFSRRLFVCQQDYAKTIKTDFHKIR